MPFDGNSHKMMGLIAHPGEISSLSISGDGNYLVTAGGRDLTVNVWKINTQAVQVTKRANIVPRAQQQTEAKPFRRNNRVDRLHHPPAIKTALLCTQLRAAAKNIYQ